MAEGSENIEVCLSRGDSWYDNCNLSVPQSAGKFCSVSVGEEGSDGSIDELATEPYQFEPVGKVD